MTDVQKWAKLRHALLEEKEQLEKQIAQFEDTPEFIEESVGELNSYDDQHPGDMGTELDERHKDVTFFYRAQEQLKEINNALTKMDNGTYGICERTGEQIPYERLEAMPTARYKL
ncbi:TraR/DksA C4-type zinc finger protein [Alkalibacillus aidingensis]|uniref:TraR/DksA C4-type zinc finger protein n=1 Tax=Alkalibacillus aidingensis TaxID=2747607 RepID=UPI0016601E2E|nr:TraR/DksA C4-type zinc finger protein [Alkalibacillus aidingensis]